MTTAVFKPGDMGCCAGELLHLWCPKDPPPGAWLNQVLSHVGTLKRGDVFTVLAATETADNVEIVCVLGGGTAGWSRASLLQVLSVERARVEER